MGKYSFATGTVTYAIRGRDMLKNEGIRAYIERSTDKDRIGCGYSIIAIGKGETILNILQKNGIKILDVKRVN